MQNKLYLEEFSIKKRKLKKEKEFYSRWCHLRITNECSNPFKTEYRRRIACPSCSERIRQLSITLQEMKKMNGIENKIEKVEWVNKNECTMTIKESTPIRDQKTNELMGKKESVITVKTTRKDIESGLDLVKERYNKNVSDLTNKQKKMESMGKKPVKTPEMVRILKAFEDLNKIREIEQIESQLKDLSAQIEVDNKFIQERTKLLQQ